jgi:hypothetical protein
MCFDSDRYIAVGPLFLLYSLRFTSFFYVDSSTLASFQTDLVIYSRTIQIALLYLHTFKDRHKSSDHLHQHKPLRNASQQTHSRPPHHPSHTMPPPLPPPLFVKRDDNMGFLFPPGVIVIFVLLGAGLLVAMGYAIHSAFGFGTDGNGFKPMTHEQESYLAEVRIRNMENLEREGRLASGGGKRRAGEVVYD